MENMPRPRPPHLHRQISRHGKTVWYVRVGRGPRIRIRADFGTPEFDAAYKAALDGETTTAVPKAANGSLEWLWNRYRETSAWAAYKTATRRQRENIMVKVLMQSGSASFISITSKEIAAGRDRRAATPAQALNFLKVMRGLFGWATEAGHVKINPTVGVKPPKHRKGRGFPVWTEDQAEAYETRWPIGTKERVWFDVLLYTGLRRGDAVVIGKQHVRHGEASLRTEKSGEIMTVTLPILPVLQRTLDAGPCGDLAFIVGARGKPITKETFGNYFREACDAAGVMEPSAHGLRKLGATRAAESGATVAELEAIFGWRGGAMAALYTEAANRKKLSRGAIAKLNRTRDEHSIPSPKAKVRGATEKDV